MAGAWLHQMNQEFTNQFGVKMAGIFQSVLAEFLLHPEKLGVKAEISGKFIDIKIKQHPADARRCIGAFGATFKALQAIGRCIGRKHNLTVNVSPIKTPPRDDQAMDGYSKFRLNPNWPKKKILDITESLAQLGFSYDQEVEIVAVDLDNNCSDFIVKIAPNEHETVIGAMGPALQALVGSVAKANGWTVMVKLVAGSPAIAQPRV